MIRRWSGCVVCGATGNVVGQFTLGENRHVKQNKIKRGF